MGDSYLADKAEHSAGWLRLNLERRSVWLLAFGVTLVASLGCSDPKVSEEHLRAAAPVRGHQAREEAADPALPLRALSLRVLQQTLASCMPVRNCSDQALHFGGLRRPFGYAVDRANRDVVILGFVDPARPRIRTEDFVVALRNSWRRFTARNGETSIYSYPGCDIRPTPKTMQQLRILEREIFASSTSEKTEQALTRWQRACESPQEVSVLGIPVDTAFGKVMVNADYAMKRLADGEDALGLPGMASVSDLAVARIQKGVRTNQPLKVGASMNRFWLAPGKLAYEKAEGIIFISSCPVQVRTHVSGTDAQGNVGDVDRSDPLAAEFARRFSMLYGKVAEQRPIYRDLASLFQMFALTQVLHHEHAEEQAGMDFLYLLDKYPLLETTVARQLPGRFAVKRFRHEQEIPGGTEILQLWLPSCGGVEMAIAPRDQDFLRNELLRSVRDRVLGARVIAPQIAWTVSAKGNLYLTGLKYSERLRAYNQPGRPLVVRVEDHGSEYRADVGQSRVLYEKDLDARKLMEKAAAQAAKQGTGRIYFVLKDFPAPKVTGFSETCQLHLKQTGSAIDMMVLNNIADTWLEPALFSPGVQFVGIQRAELVTEGRFRNLYRGLAKFRVWAGGALRTVSIAVLGRSVSSVDAFLEQIGAPFSLIDSLPISIIHYLDLARQEMRRTLGDVIRELQIQFEHVHWVDTRVPRAEALS